jgi:hypothetical protein
MGRGVLQSIMAVSCVATIGGWATAAWSANPFELSFWLSGPRYDSVVPLCHEHGPLKKIQTRFGDKETRFWNGDIEIVGFERIREIAWEPWASGTIPRRFCEASAVMSDGKHHQLFYSIAEDTGITGFGYGVEWCVVGFDRNWAYNPSCRMARP